MFRRGREAEEVERGSADERAWVGGWEEVEVSGVELSGDEGVDGIGLAGWDGRGGDGLEAPEVAFFVGDVDVGDGGWFVAEGGGAGGDP